MVGSIRNALGAFIQLLRSSSTLNTNLLNSRIYPPGITESSTMPRVNVGLGTPADKIMGLGITAAYPTRKLLTFTVDCWDKDPKRCEQIAAIIEDVVGANRNYAPSTIVINNQSGAAQSVSANGYFFLLKLAGGTQTVEVKKQQYRRTLLFSGSWIQTG